MFLNVTDSMVRKLRQDDKIDPGTFSIMEPGWWVLHAAAIAGVYVLGSRLNSRH